MDRTNFIEIDTESKNSLSQEYVKKMALENFIRKRRKLLKEPPNAENIPHNSEEKKSESFTKECDQELRQKATEIILRESKNSAERASRVGPQGW